MNTTPTSHRVAKTLSKGRRRLPVAIALLTASIASLGWQLASSSNKTSTTISEESPLPIGSGTFNIKLSEGGSVK